MKNVHTRTQLAVNRKPRIPKQQMNLGVLLTRPRYQQHEEETGLVELLSKMIMARCTTSKIKHKSYLESRKDKYYLIRIYNTTWLTILATRFGRIYVVTYQYCFWKGMRNSKTYITNQTLADIEKKEKSKSV